MNLKNSLSNLFRIAFLLTIILSVNNFSQNISDDKNLLPSPMKGLVAIHYPDLKDLEKEVREQIESFQIFLLKATKTSPTTKDDLGNSYGTMGEIYQAYSMYDPAVECYLNAATLMPNDFKWQYLLGKVSEEQNKTSKAIDYYKMSQKLRPDYLPIYINLGNAYLELNLLSDAKQNFEKALELNKDNPAALYGLGQINFSEGKFEDAKNHFEKVLQIVPDANRVHYSLAIAYRELKNVEKAKFHLSKQGTVGIRVADPLFDGLNELKQGVRLRLLRGKQALEAKRYNEAEIEFQKALAIKPNSVPALVNYGVTLVELKNFPEAISNFEKAVKLSPDNANARYNLAVLLSAQNKHFQAISHLKSILEKSPKDVSARFLLAKELRNANLLAESLSEFVNVYNSIPDNEDVLIEFTQLLVMRGNHKQAKDLLENSYTKFPDRGRTIAALAYLLAASPQPDLRDGKKALELSLLVFNSTKLVNHGAIVALAYAELGQCEDAAKLTRQLITKVEEVKDSNLLVKLKNELNRYENEKPCRAK